jgi:hypothetical protein
MSGINLKKLADVSWSKNFPAFYGTRKFIIVFARAPDSPYPEADESYPHPSIMFH